MLDNLNIEHVGSLSQCYKEIEKLKEDNEKLVSRNIGLKTEISDLTIVDRQLSRKDGQADGGN
jgi:cell division protein FtsB